MDAGSLNLDSMTYSEILAPRPLACLHEASVTLDNVQTVL